MSIPIDPTVEAGLTDPAEEQLFQADQELESLALERLDSGDAITVGPGYWEEKHHRLEERLKKIGTRVETP